MSIKTYELRSVDYTILKDLDEPTTIVSTGFENWEGATELHVYRRPGTWTFVVPCGEVQNGEPWMCDPEVTDAEILEDYRAEVLENFEDGDTI